MSEFDKVFGSKITKNLVFLTNTSSEYDEIIATNILGISNIDTMSAENQTILAKERQSKQNIIDSITENKTTIESCKSKVLAVVNLSDTEKSQLYNIYTITTKKKQLVIGTLMANHENIINDSSPILTDPNLSTEQKTMLIDAIADKYFQRNNMNELSYLML